MPVRLCRRLSNMLASEGTLKAGFALSGSVVVRGPDYRDGLYKGEDRREESSGIDQLQV